MNTEMFIKNVNHIHNNRYDYSKVNYINCNIEVDIICKEHGIFKQKPCYHSSGRGCGLCAKNKLYTLDEYKEKANKIHNNKFKYIDFIKFKNKRRILLECPIHGVFDQNITRHLNGADCVKCCDNNKLYTKDLFIYKANLKHNNKYNYDKMIYAGINEKICIICEEHGEFWQKAHNHLCGQGCSTCGGSAKITYNEFLRRAKLKHDDIYNYDKSNIDFLTTKNKICIICKEHGEFWQTPESHMSGSGCRKCGSYKAIKSMLFKISNFQQEIYDFCKSLDDSFIMSNKDVIKPYEIDIYSDKLRIGVECHGMYFHSCGSIDEIKKKKYKHFDKCNISLSKNIKLIQIFEYEWINKCDIIKDIIRHNINKSIKIYARKCEIREIDNKTYKSFINMFHLYGYKYSEYRYGLFYNNELYSVMSFSRHNIYKYELDRYAVKCGYAVVGGASKLFNRFVTLYVGSILSYCDRRFSDGKLYKQLGFRLDGVTKPNYCYIKGYDRYSRQNFQKHKLAKKLIKFNINKTESENMTDNGYRQLFDAGHFRFIKD